MSTRTILAALIAMLAAAALPAWAHEGESHEPMPKVATTAVDPGASEEERARAYFTDLPVVTQDGEQLRFYSDVLKDRVVLISLFYLNCKSACPLTTARLAEVQEVLGEDLGREFVLVSLTIDPEHDTVEGIKAYADKFKAKDGWLFLTGRPEDIKQIARRLGHVSPDIEAHNTHYFIGNVKIARWAKLQPNLPAEAIVARLRQMAEFTTAD